MISRHVTRVVCTAAAAAGLLVAGLAGPASADSTGNAASTGNGASTENTAGYRTFSGRLYGVAATSASNVWAVGLHPNSSLIVHWNGTTWTQSLATRTGYFNGVATDARTDAWAVGGTNWFSPSKTFIEYWNGMSWTRVPSPSPGEGGYLNAVTAISRTDAWAVGLIGPGGSGAPGNTTPLIEHWDGTSWTQVPCPIPAHGGQFTSVSATSPADVWAVGFTGGDASNSKGQQTLIEHWNGTSWTRVPSPNPAGGQNFLKGVAATSPANAWAVGSTMLTSHQNAVILHWNGTSWATVPSNSRAADAELQSVATTSGHDAWAVGMTNPSTCSPQCRTMILHWSTDFDNTLITHWNGKTWSGQSSP